jgi:hypothetical protein
VYWFLYYLDYIFILPGRPIQFGNLSFTWRSPKNDKGPVKFQASVVYQGKYLMIDAKINGSKIKNGRGIPYEAFPVNVFLSVI